MASSAIFFDYGGPTMGYWRRPPGDFWVSSRRHSEPGLQPGSLYMRTRENVWLYRVVPPLECSRFPSLLTMRARGEEFQDKYGYFSKGGKEYVVTTPFTAS